MRQTTESGDGVDPQSKARWAEEIRRGAISLSPSELRSIVRSMREFSTQRDHCQITVQRYRRLAMDLLCQAISYGAFESPEWRRFRTKLADDPSFVNAASLFASDSQSRIMGVTQDGKRFIDDGTWEISSHIDRIASEIESLENQKSSVEESGMGEHHAQNEANTNSHTNGKQETPANHLLLALEGVAFVGVVAYILASWSEHSDAWWMINLVLQLFDFAFCYLVYGVLAQLAKWNHSNSLLGSIIAGILLGVALTVPYAILPERNLMPIVPIVSRARFLFPIIITVLAFLSWCWAVFMQASIAPQNPQSGSTRPSSIRAMPPTVTPSLASPQTTTPNTIQSPSANPAVRQPASRPTTVPGPDTRSQLQIFKGDPPPIDNLYYAEVGHGAMADLTQWLDFTDQPREKLAEWVKALLRESDPVRVSPETLHIGRDFLHGDDKVLKLYFCGDLKFLFEEKEQLSVAAIREKLKRKIDATSPGFTLCVLSNFGEWHAGAVISEFDLIKNHPTFRNDYAGYIANFMLHLEKGRFEIIG